MPTLSSTEAIQFLHEAVSNASDEDILDGWDRNLRAVVYRSWFHAAIDGLNGRIAQSDLDLWQRALKSQPRARLATESSISTSSSTSPDKSPGQQPTNRLRRSASTSAASSSSSSRRIVYNAPTRPSPVLIPVDKPNDQNGALPKIKKRRSEPRGLASRRRQQKQQHVAPPVKKLQRSPSPDRTRQFEQLNFRLGELKSFIDEQFQSLRQAEMYHNSHQTPPPKRRAVQVGNSSGGDSPPETSPSPSPSPKSRSRRRKLRKRSAGQSTPVAALDMIQETAHTAVQNDEDVVATVIESPQCENTPPPIVPERAYLLVSPKGRSKASSSLSGRMHVVSPASLPKSPIYDSQWEPKMSDTRVSAGLIPLREACVVTPSPDILLDDDDGDELDNILAKYL